MPSDALTVHLPQLLEDANELNEAYDSLRTAGLASKANLAALDRAVVVICVSAWESYLEELMRESLKALRPPTPPLGAWPALSAHILGLVGRFHTPNALSTA